MAQDMAQVVDALSFNPLHHLLLLDLDLDVLAILLVPATLLALVQVTGPALGMVLAPAILLVPVLDLDLGTVLAQVDSLRLHPQRMKKMSKMPQT